MHLKAMLARLNSQQLNQLRVPISSVENVRLAGDKVALGREPKPTA
jgi:hypothetical protein